MKIAVIAPTFLPARRANTFQVMKMAQALVSIGHDVRLAVPANSLSKPARGIDWRNIAQHYGLQHRFPIDWVPGHPQLRRYDYSLRALRWARSWEADIVYTRLPQAATISSLLGVSSVFEVHDLPQRLSNKLSLRLYLLGRGAKRLVVISHSLLHDLESEYKLPVSKGFIVVAPDGVDLVRYKDLPAPREARSHVLSLAPDLINTHAKTDFISRFTVGYSGHFYPGRGEELLLHLAVRLPEITFLLVGGESSDVERLRNQTQSQKLSNIILTGFIPNMDLPIYQAACDVLLMPYQLKVEASSGGDISRYLSPMKLFEYLACGRLIISSDLPVLREVLSDRNAILLSPEDEDAWVKQLLHFKTNPDEMLPYTKQALQDSRQYSWEKRAKLIMEGIA